MPVPEPVDVSKVEIKTAAKPVKKEKPFILKDTSGEVVDSSEYFYNGKNPIGFSEFIPVEREDLLEIFNKAFNPKMGFLFYKSIKSEVYLVIVPLKYSTVVSAEQESADGDFQKHALSFIGEGSVNPDTLRSKLARVLKFVKIGDN